MHNHSSLVSESTAPTAHPPAPVPFAFTLLNAEGEFAEDSPVDSITLDKARQLYDDYFKTLEENMRKGWRWDGSSDLKILYWVIKLWVEQAQSPDWSLMDVSTGSFSPRIDINETLAS